MESEFVPIVLVYRAIELGLLVPLGGESFVRIEQLERWIWEEHRELFPISYTMMVKAELVFGIVKMVDLSNVPIYFPDPFSARLAGVERVIEELEKRQSIAQMEKGTR